MKDFRHAGKRASNRATPLMPVIRKKETVSKLGDLPIAPREIVQRKIDTLAASIGMFARLTPAFDTPRHIEENKDRRIQWIKRVANYEQYSGYPDSLMIGGDGRTTGIWILGNDYRVASGYYGGYPATYLRRIKLLFPDKKRVLHLFSGKVDLAIMPGDTVDLSLSAALTHPPGTGMHFTDDAQTLTRVPLSDYDLVMCDPPYSVEDAEHYQTSMVNRTKVFRALQRCKPGTHIVWLDQVLPMWRKDFFDLEAIIGVMRSTNHRFRCVTIFRRI